MGTSYTKRDLVNELAAKYKISKKRVDQLLGELAEIAYREAREGFTLPGICKLDVVLRKERRARNPQTGETLLIGAHDVLRVRPLKRAKQTVAPTPPGLVRTLPPEESQPEANLSEVPNLGSLFSFGCPYCNADIEVSRDCVGDRISCPACKGPFVVPSVGGKAKPERNVPSAQPAAPAAPAARPASPQEDAEQFVSFLCKTCGQEIEAPIDMAGSQDECPSCGAVILIPYVSEPGTTQTLRQASADPALIDAAKGRTLRIELPDDL